MTCVSFSFFLDVSFIEEFYESVKACIDRLKAEAAVDVPMPAVE